MAFVDKKDDNRVILEILNDDYVLHSIVHFIELSPSDNKFNPSYSLRHTYIYFLNFMCFKLIV